MARLSVSVRNKKRKKMVARYAEKRERLKKEGKWEELDKLPKNASPVRLRNRCNLTGRSRGYIRDFGLCRIVFRDMAHQGRIPGVTKSSW